MRLAKVGVCTIATVVTILGSVTCYAAGSPKFSVKFDKTGKTAEIICNNIPEDTCGVQAEFPVTPDNATFTITPSEDDAFCEIRNTGGNVVIYIDRATPIGSNGVVNFGKISSSDKFQISSPANLITVDSALQDTTYTATVSVTKPNNGGSDDDDSENGSTGGGGSSGGGGGSSGGGGGVSSSSNKTNTTKPTVEVSENGSVKVSSDGNTITITPDEGYVIKDVLINGKSIGPVKSYKFDKNDKKRVVKVEFEAIAETEPEKTEETKTPNEITKPVSFADVAQSFWAKDAIDFAVSNGLFYGTEKDLFSPNTDMTRAMFVTVLNRFEGAFGSKWHIDYSSPASFEDVTDGNWYTEAIKWAGGTGLVSGIGNDMFGPDEPITREQIAVILVKYANQCGITLPELNEEKAFNDSENISEWAREAVSIAQKAGILSGRQDGSLGPKDLATRAEVASMLQRFIANIE